MMVSAEQAMKGILKVVQDLEALPMEIRLDNPQVQRIFEKHQANPKLIGCLRRVKQLEEFWASAQKYMEIGTDYIAFEQGPSVRAHKHRDRFREAFKALLDE